MNADNQLLESYAHRGSESAFRELVERHINLVHSAAMRESGGNASLAEDITQAVFTELARRAAKLISHPSLAGWLYTCVRHTTANVRRAENRRHRREQEAFTMNEMLNADPADKLWQQVRPVLDDVMHELNDEDRAAVVMRFFEGRSLKEVGQALGLTENAARMRVERSLEKLHGLLSRRGVKSTAATLAAVVAAGAVLSAPASLAATVSAGALTAAAFSSSGLFGLGKFMNLTKIKIIGTATAVMATAALTIWSLNHFHRVQSESINPASVVAASPTSAAVNPAPQNMAAASPTIASAMEANQMALQVVEAETGRPLANTKVLLAYLREDGRGKDVKQITDAQGRLAVDGLETPFHFLNMFITSDGHVPKVTTLGRSGALPPSYKMKMDRGIRIGGVVVDEAGQSISGAKIEFDYPGGNNMALQENIQFGPDAVSMTDADGHWFCNMIPKDLDHIFLKVTHPDHAEASATIKPDSTDANDTSITMAAGFTVAGTVQDTNGNAIAGAKVRTVRMNSEGEQSKKTDEGGAFAMKCITGGELILSVQAKGFAPETQTLTVTGPVAGLKFLLGPGRLLRGRILDEAGSPITNGFAETLREATRKFVWSSKTDSEGRFEWDSAPQQPILYSFQAEGYNRGYAMKLEADGSEHVITLAHKQPGKDDIQVSGTAVDAASGQPLGVFSVLQRKVQSDWAPPFGFIADGKDGQFTFTSPAAALTTNYQLETECKGYLPAVSGILHVADGNQKLEFRLQKGSGPSGVVLLPTGEPAANATVLLCTSQAGVTLEGAGRVAKGINTTTYSTKTDRNGKFALPAVYAPEGLIAIHEVGFAQLSVADCEANGGILLHAWGGVEGTLVLDGQPAANETIVAYAQECRYDENGRRFGFLTMDRETKTDAAGKFSFDKLPPCQCRIGRRETASGRELVRFNSHEATVVIKAGAVTQVALGGTGRPVIGSVIMPGVNNAIDWMGVPVYLTTKLANQPGPRPRRDDFAVRQAYIDAMDGWIATFKSQKPYGAFCDASGAFRLQSIPAGTYELKIVLHDPNRQESFPNPHFEPESEMGSLTREVLIPEMDGGQSSEPLDLGTLELTPHSETVASH